ncbi:MAG: hypothetical protein CVU89_11030 [Firmicutes bacterium HGW-Firmicutes-14]|nr:MAG: hypothetical protein CVU89_11030 [Firmicutes bacterium HGW-Firmicutes-14]
MLTKSEYIRKSLETNLFFLRIMKEHALFLEAGFVCKDINHIREAERLKNEFSRLLAEAVSLANGVVSPELLSVEAIVTDNTLAAEQATENLSGIPINTAITRAELALTGGFPGPYPPVLENRISLLNQRAIPLTDAIINFKGMVLNGMLSCRLYTTLFPLLIDHIRREAILYRNSLIRLQSRLDPDDPAMAAQLEAFWNRIMAEHSLFIRNLLDPTEVELFNTTQAFAARFEKLEDAAEAAESNEPALEKVTRQSLEATREISTFKEQATELILMHKIKSIIVPLLGDHVTREANHFLHLLKHFEKTL